MERVLDAIEVFLDRLAAVEWTPLLLAVLVHLVKLACTARAWRNVLAAAYPEEKVSYPRIWAAYAAGVGVNAILPARSGDALRLYLAHRAIPTASYVTLAASLLVMSLFDMFVALCVYAFALTQGVLPGLDVLPDLPSFDFAFFLDHPRLSIAIGAVAAVLLVVGGFWAHARVQAFRERVGQGLAVLRDRPRYFRSVAFWQACDWGLRFVTISLFLRAFGIEPSLRNVLLVQATQSLATLVPVSPGGIGTEQAFIVYVFRGAVASSQLLAFSVGMKLTLLVTNVAVGAAVILLTLRTLRFRRFTRQVGAAPTPPRT
jgi:uncharacterized membrane protein YbhN (UPF0104 family)